MNGKNNPVYTGRPFKIFLSTFQKDIDAKGRITIPSEFRTVLISSAQESGIGQYGFVAFRSYTHKAIECFTVDRMEKLSEQMDNLDPFSSERDNLSASVFADSHFVTFDPSDGRAKIPKELLDYACIEKGLAFVGKGATFQIWNIDEFEKHQSNAREVLRENRK